MQRLTLLSLLLLATSLVGCADGSDDRGSDCIGGKCDDPGSARDQACRLECGDNVDCLRSCIEGKSLELCQERRDDALLSAQQAFTPDAIRWAAADVDGVNTNGGDDRGQEYTEYFAIVALPGQQPTLLGKPTGQIVELDDHGNVTRAETTSTPLSLDLDEDAIFDLEDLALGDNPAVGQCVFTSWHVDVPGPLPCAGGDCPSVMGFALDETIEVNRFDRGAEETLQVKEPLFRMVVGFNSNGAASDLVAQCVQVPEGGDPDDPTDPLHDDFMRGCMMTSKLGPTGFGTEWRRSDSAVCVASMRLAECGCGVDTNGDGIADIVDADEIGQALVPSQPTADGSISLRGFPLGTWSSPDALPAGCRYVDPGDGSKTVVTCDLTASDVLGAQNDPKGLCRDKYADNVVVHVPIPAAAVVCEPPADGKYVDSCGEMPWVVTDESSSHR